MSRFYASNSQKPSPSEEQHEKLAEKLAGECVVLLRNDGILPISPCQIALFGAGAGQTIRGGTGSGDVNARRAVSIEEGLRDAGFAIASSDWLARREQSIQEAKEQYREYIKTESEKSGLSVTTLGFLHPFQNPEPEAFLCDDLALPADTACYVISRNSGEGADRYDEKGDYHLSDTEREQLTQLGAHYRKVIVVLNIGGVINIRDIESIPGIRAILLMSQLGSAGGKVLAKILTGSINPSGKLADSWAIHYRDYPSSESFSHNNGNTDDDNYSEGIYVGYRYFETMGIATAYPFGFGLSYTTFELSRARVNVTGETVEVNVLVTNTGRRYAGKEVVEVYVSAPAGELDKPVKELRGFTKTQLLVPGECQEVSVTFPVRSMASYSEQRAAWILEAGDYTVCVGNCSDNTTIAGLVRLDQTIVTEQLRNLFAHDNQYKELRPAQHLTDSEAKTAPAPDVIALDAATVRTHTARYSSRIELQDSRREQLTMQDLVAGRCTAEELTAQLTVPEMSKLCVGALVSSRSDVVGNASVIVPGAAGDTSPICQESRGIRSLIMADGPAGLRLQPHFKARMDGTLLPGGEIFGDAVNPFPREAEREDVQDYYQYCTALPIGWALAMSWNTDLVREAGDLVGSEMEQFGVDLWLAPAMNIHRNPLCGRNFEYYSEDPFLSGQMAAAMTEGIQKHPGKGVSIKHFAVNNQEDNRYQTNVHVSERALREIYLRGFEIAVRRAKPKTIMTSYTMINGVHCANSYELLQAVARDEWGFDGFVMTDWFSTHELPELQGAHDSPYPWASSIGCIHAGNDVQMPGHRENVDDIVAGIEKKATDQGFAITLADLQFCTCNLIRVIAGIETAKIKRRPKSED